MLKILFTEFAELRQGDGKGPQFFPGKVYWLTPDQAVRWKAEGVAEDASVDSVAENEPERGPEPLRPGNVRIVKRKNKFHVIGPEGYPPFHDEPLTADEAEKLRQRILSGDVPHAAPAAPVIIAAPEPTVAEPAKPEPAITPEVIVPEVAISAPIVEQPQPVAAPLKRPWSAGPT